MAASHSTQKPDTMACRACTRVLPFTPEFFARCRQQPFGLRVRCRDCTNGQARAYFKDYRHALRLEVLTHYSGGNPECACCGVRTFEFLALDHLTGSSQEDCRLHGSTDKFFQKLKKHGYPSNFQVLCHNCNACKSILGYCVHHPERKPDDFYARKGGARTVEVTPASEASDSSRARQCRLCHRVFPLNAKNFHRREGSPSGLRYECKECHHIHALRRVRQRMNEYKELALWYYCDGAPRCGCCGEDAFEFLTIDHVDGGGNQHRKEEGYFNLGYWLVKNHFPPGYACLCFCCNMAKGFYGSCPHSSQGTQPKEE